MAIYSKSQVMLSKFGTGISETSVDKKKSLMHWENLFQKFF